MPQTYVLGFLFDRELQNVVLIEKQKPDWQKGRYNGVGGKLEDGETLNAAMSREFHEEAGVLVAPEAWTQYATITGADGRHFAVHVFYAQDAQLWMSRTMEEERVIVTDVKAVLQSEFKTLGNVPWLVAMACAVAAGKETCKLFNIEERA